MEEQETTLGPQVNTELAKHVCNEQNLLATLDVSYDTLSRLRRSKGFPTVYLNKLNRVYLVSEVLDWLKRNRGVSRGVD